MDAFRKQLGKTWPCLKKVLVEKAVQNFSLWTAAHLVFGYYETDAESDAGKEIRRILSSGSDCFEWISAPDETMRLMYADYGIVRRDKDLIRHRVFITKLKNHNVEEYKRRHDRLSQSRKGVDPGPDSNFTIWNGGEYIFGYDEIDTSMEKEPDVHSREETIRWETHMLEIMDWITDDTDWITGGHHDHIQLLAHCSAF